MKNPNELRQFISFQLNECDALKEYLEEMALKGWKLKYVKNSFYFEKITPQKLYYSVEVFAKGSIYDTTPSYETYNYIEYCKKAGWEYVCAFGQTVIFVSESEKTIPIETDQEQKFDTIRKSMLKQHILTWSLIPIFTVNVILDFINFEFTVTNNLGIFNCLCFIFVIMVGFIKISSFIAWSVKQKHKLKRGEPIQYISKSNRKKKIILQLTPVFIITIILLFVAINSLVNKEYITASTIVLVFLFISVVILFSLYLNKQKFSRTSNKAFIILFSIGLSLFILPFTIILVLLFSNDSVIEGANYSEKSFLASSATYYYNSEDGSEFTVEIFKSDYDFIIDQYIYSETHRFFKEDYEVVNLPEWNPKSSYISRNSYYIEFEDFVVSLSTEENLTQLDIEKIKSLAD